MWQLMNVLQFCPMNCFKISFFALGLKICCFEIFFNNSFSQRLYGLKKKSQNFFIFHLPKLPLKVLLHCTIWPPQLKIKKILKQPFFMNHCMDLKKTKQTWYVSCMTFHQNYSYRSAPLYKNKSFRTIFLWNYGMVWIATVCVGQGVSVTSVTLPVFCLV